MGRLLFTRTAKSTCSKTTNNHYKPEKNKIVYELYGLTDKEISTVKNS